MTEQTSAELLYRYAIPSQVRRADNSNVLLLGISGGTTTEVTEGPALHPYFFKGFLTQPALAAAGMLACGGVHARLDLLPDALEEAPRASGTTNVDFNQPMRAALASAAAGGSVLLSVGTDEVAVTTV